MSSNEIDIQLIAYDQASSVIESVGSNLSTTFTNIEGNTQELQSTTDDATSEISADYQQVDDTAQSMSDSVDTANQSCSSSAMAMNSTALAGMSLYMSFNNVENAEISLDRAHVTVEKDTLAVQKAQEAYNAAVAKYGPNSQQAIDAAQKLKDAQDTLTVAQERAGEAQRNVNNSMIMAALTVIPSLIAVVNLVANATQIWTGIQAALDAVMDANPISILVLAIAGLVAGIIVAYNTCKPFRDAINEIGSVLMSVLKPAVTDITAGLTWFWKNVFEPLANFVEAYFILEFQTLSTVLTWLWKNVFEPLGKFLAAVFMTDVKAISDVCNFLWNNVLKPFGEFLVGVFSDAWSGLSTIIQGFYNIVKPIIDAVDTAVNAMGGFVKDVSGALGGAGKAISNFIGGICFAHALEGAANSSNRTMGDWVDMVKNSMNKGLTAIKDFNSQAQIGGSQMIGAIGGGGSLPSAQSKQTVVNIDNKAPLVYIEGSADKATADLASKQVLQSLQTIIVEPTSTHAASTQKRIRAGSVFG